MRIVADENIPGLEGLAASVSADLRRLPGRSITATEVHNADALLIRSVTRVDAGLIDSAPRLRFVGTATSGHDHIDRQRLMDRGIAFAHAPGSNARSVIEYVLAAIAETDDFLERLFAGGRVGIVGYGNIGQRLGRCLDGLGIDWSVSDPWKEPAGIPNAAPLAHVLSADVVTLHTELTEAMPFPSCHLLNRRTLACLSSRTLLINASRGAVVDNIALRGRLDAVDAPLAVLDVWENEPMPDTDLLARLRFGSAHIAGYSWDGKLLATRMLLAEMAAALSITPPVSQSEAAPALDVAAGHTDSAGFVRALLSQRYRVAEDDRLLREAMHAAQSAESKGRAFDSLRRSYRQRRELAGSAVDGRRFNNNQRRLVTSLGVIIEDGAG
ncbi:4-phosphoerythronate dehydrogenase [Chromatocurvus halotolerans]|uniref:Erythronate-4-phosphate dehydrogenase n=1 Tax=Chromatocurvus halotolerans TaxID=1132028 RepID=A0A4R2KVI4_9GAMM|nr:4-phosphoerythronate dehydrogenase [Chromatocurvus halotolerans]TCO77833.1 4-phosphoerythronate dehydrogenase [Chromatocurvus halotolerans]